MYFWTFDTRVTFPAGDGRRRGRPRLLDVILYDVQFLLMLLRSQSFASTHKNISVSFLGQFRCV